MKIYKLRNYEEINPNLIKINKLIILEEVPGFKVYWFISYDDKYSRMYNIDAMCCRDTAIKQIGFRIL